MQIYQSTDLELITLAKPPCVVTFAFDQIEVGNNLCVTLINLGAHAMVCTFVKKYPFGIDGGDYALDTAAVALIGTLGASGTLTDRALFEQTGIAYKAIQFLFTGTTGEQIRAKCSIGSAR